MSAHETVRAYAIGSVLALGMFAGELVAVLGAAMFRRFVGGAR